MLTTFGSILLVITNLHNDIGSENLMEHKNLTHAEEGKEYIVQKIDTEDEELNDFLFTLGCYAGEPITVVSHLKGGCVVSIKDGRYNIDNQLAEAIIIS